MKLTIGAGWGGGGAGGMGSQGEGRTGNALKIRVCEREGGGGDMGGGRGPVSTGYV